MWKVLRRCLFALSMVAWGGVMLYLYQGPHIDAYVAEKFQFTVLLGGLACCVAGVFNLLNCRVETDCGHGDGCDHDHESSELNPVVALGLIVVPLVFSLSVTEHKIDAAHLDKKSSLDIDPASMRFLADLPPFTKETLDSTRQKSADGFYQMNLLELFYSAGDSELERVFTGLDFETEGMLRSEPNRNESGKRMRLYRMFVTCCAADMKAIPISVEFADALPEYDANTWVKVGGSLMYERVEGVTYPVLKIKRIELTDAPDNGALYK